jgi:transposase-like protein
MGRKRDRDLPPARCTGKRADGRPCRNTPLEGTTRCWHHSFRVPGRPSKLNADVQERILDAVLEGAYLETAAQAAGVSKAALYRWLRRADEAEAKALEHLTDAAADDPAQLYEVTDPADWPYLDFRHALKTAEAFAELELIRKTTRPVGGQPWAAYMTVLERRWPDRWRRRDHVTHGGEVELSKPRDVIPDTDERRDAVKSVLYGALRDHPEFGPENTPE